MRLSKSRNYRPCSTCGECEEIWVDRKKKDARRLSCEARSDIIRPGEGDRPGFGEGEESVQVGMAPSGGHVAAPIAPPGGRFRMIPTAMQLALRIWTADPLALSSWTWKPSFA